MIIALSVSVGILLIFQFVFILTRVIYFWKNNQSDLPSDFPFVSVLIAARNEETQLPQLFESLEKLDYSDEKIMFLFANDQSTDRTEKLLEDWCGKKSNRKFITISDSEIRKYHPNGKANALAILGDYAKGDFLFFTDADCEVNPNWIKAGVAAFGPKIGLVIGITQVSGRDFFGRFQTLDWLNTLGLVKVASDLGLRTTGLGNNMVIEKSAYIKSGGFKNLPDTLTEDLEISKSIANSGFKISHQISSGMLTKTKQEDSIKSLLQQRKRWFSGVITLPFFWLILLSLQFFYLPAVLVLVVHNILFGVGVFLVKTFLQGVFLGEVASRAGMKLKWNYLIGFDFYFFLINALTILYYFWPSKIRWKSRDYS
ncbi:MAG: glycosyltransferase [Algoriphagus sp.]|uniref:glycosyltransferase n=1 Tax=Algoriphagus sp. TaxID=1872435 RepID=UPI0026203D11|nr:glycosyltransferase [Algoriphagus sp.]MDG1276974.1 glycosyltransferase [Algoriphagus sp.]